MNELIIADVLNKRDIFSHFYIEESFLDAYIAKNGLDINKRQLVKELMSYGHIEVCYTDFGQAKKVKLPMKLIFNGVEYTTAPRDGSMTTVYEVKSVRADLLIQNCPSMTTKLIVIMDRIMSDNRLVGVKNAA
jgi:hypothetical protein